MEELVLWSRAWSGPESEGETSEGQGSNTDHYGVLQKEGRMGRGKGFNVRKSYDQPRGEGDNRG